PVDAALEDVDPYLGTTAKLALYRIVQEALSNARRHAASGRATLRLAAADGYVVAEVEDRGRGFDPVAALERDRGIGLIGMRERATMVGGRVVVDSAPGRGTVVRVLIPITTA